MSAERPSLQRSILAALAYFDVFDFPLTLVEISRFLPRTSPEDDAAPALADIRRALLDCPVGERDGYYFLSGRDATVDRRREKYLLAAGKYRKARRLTAFLRLLPSVRLVAVCNSLAISNAERDSDIDFFVVTKPGTVWFTRLLTTGVVSLLGLRPDERTQRDRYCLSFFVTENSLNLSGLALPTGDTYLLYWLATLRPLYDAGGVMEKLAMANAWVGKSLPAHAISEKDRPAAVELDKKPLGILEGFAKRLQGRLFPKAIADLANRDSRVVVSDDMLKFHVNDRRAEIENAFRGRLRTLGIAYE